MNAYATIDDITNLWRSMTPEETQRAEALLPVVSDSLRQEAMNRGKNLDEMIESGKVLENTVKSVTVDITTRTLLTSTENEPTTQFSQSAMGYSVSGTYLVPGGGLFIKNSELKKLGLKASQRIGGINLYDKGDNNTTD